MNGHAKLPTELFKVRIPLIATYTDAEIAMFGIPLEVRDGKVDYNRTDELTTVMISLDSIIDKYIAGYPIYLVDEKETAVIYKYLENYIKGKDEQEEYSINRAVTRDPRIEEIDRFADEMFGLNRHTIVTGNISANTGYDLGFNLMSYQQPVTNNGPSRATGAMAGYDQPLEDNNNIRTTYINNNAPVIDVNKLKRTSLLKKRRMVTKT